MNERPPAKVTLEDLLHLKRAERPAPEFWSGFERQLRTKQLAAIIDKRPWWNSLPRSVMRMARWSIPVGAAAAAVVTVALVSRPARAPAPLAIAQAMSPTPAKQSSVTFLTTQPAVSMSRAESARDVTRTAKAMEESSAAPAIVAAADAISPEQLARLLTGLGQGSFVDSAHDSEASLSAELASSASVMGHVSTEVAATGEPAVSQTVDEGEPTQAVTRVVSARDTRRRQLLAEAHAGSFDNNADVVRSRERSVRRLAERQLNDSISRIGLGGNNVSLKF